MAAKQFDIDIEQGATFFLTITYKNSIGVPIDLTGYKARMQIRDPATGKKWADATTENSRITVSALGVISVSISHLETQEMKGEIGVYDLFIETPTADVVTKLIYGDVKNTKAVTMP